MGEVKENTYGAFVQNAIASTWAADVILYDIYDTYDHKILVPNRSFMFRSPFLP